MTGWGTALVLMGTLLFPSTGVCGPGDHIRPNDSTIITPSLTSRFAYRSNVYRSEADPVYAGELYLQPKLEIAVDTPQLDWGLDGAWGARKFIFVGAPSDGAVIERSDRLQNLDQFNEFNAGTGLVLFERSVVGLEISDRATLRNNSADADYAQAPFTSQTRNRASGALRISPGEALELKGGVTHTMDIFQTPGLDGLVRFNSRTIMGPTGDLRWNFFPRTSFVVSAVYEQVRWQDTVVSFEDDGEIGSLQNELALPNSDHLKIRSGFEGQLTKKLYIDILLGAGQAIYDGSSSDVSKIDTNLDDGVAWKDGFLIASQVRYKPSEQSSVGLSYRKDFLDAFFTNVVKYDTVQLTSSFRWASVEPSFGYLLRTERYSGDLSRDDILNRFSGAVRLYAAQASSFELGMWWQERASSDVSVEYADVSGFLTYDFVY
jgi:hypothetical protein